MMDDGTDSPDVEPGHDAHVTAPRRRYRPWTDADTAVTREMVALGHLVPAIARALDRDANVVHRNIARHGITYVVQVNYWTPEEDAVLGTLPDPAIGVRIGRSASAVRSRRHQLGIPPWQLPSEAFIGAMYIDQIREGWSPKSLAAERGITRTAIHIARRRYNRAVEAGR